MKKIIQLAILLYLVFANVGCVPLTPLKDEDEIVEKSLKNEANREIKLYDKVSNDEVNKKENEHSSMSKDTKTLEKSISDFNKQKSLVDSL